VHASNDLLCQMHVSGYGVLLESLYMVYLYLSMICMIDQVRDIDFISTIWKLFCTLAYPSSVFLSCVVCLVFAIITYSMRAYMVSSFRGTFGGWGANFSCWGSLP